LVETSMKQASGQVYNKNFLVTKRPGSKHSPSY
jgi:hypothetical protein